MKRETLISTSLFDALTKPARSVPRLTLPLGIRPEDTSAAAFRARENLHTAAAAINPKGWRTPSTKRGITKAPLKRDRYERLRFLARMERGADVATAFGVSA